MATHTKNASKKDWTIKKMGPGKTEEDQLVAYYGIIILRHSRE